MAIFALPSLQALSTHQQAQLRGGEPGTQAAAASQDPPEMPLPPEGEGPHTDPPTTNG